MVRERSVADEARRGNGGWRNSALATAAGLLVALFGSLLVGSIPGIIICSHLSTLVPEKVLRPLPPATLAVAGGKLAF